ncbi:sigma-70 family RNA polymerase sigma factor [Reichenbachiella sp. MALMAid0571]|uniref:RNA polymerase sigma factor n=1 Tax=Reichenbachiella sp. MALMAid0571 TaxID=3143939 RepID=UPI0032DFF139
MKFDAVQVTGDNKSENKTAWEGKPDLSKFGEMDDFRIWKLFKQGDESAFVYIYKKYFKTLHNYGFQFTRNDNLIEDAIQDLFMDLRDRKEHLSDTDSIQPYLYQAYRRKIIRQRDREKKVFNELPATTFELDFSIEDSIIEKQTKEEITAKLKSEITKLSEQQREVLYLYFYKDFSYGEIGSILGYENTKSVRNLMYKTLDLLRESVPSLTLVTLMEILSTTVPKPV